MKNIVVVFLLLTISNFFVISAWYLNLKFTEMSIPAAILMSWTIALFEYCFHIPAARIAHKGVFTTAKIEIVRLVINVSVFMILLKVYFNETVSFNEAIAFMFILFSLFAIGFDYAKMEPEDIA